MFSTIGNLSNLIDPKSSITSISTTNSSQSAHLENENYHFLVLNAILDPYKMSEIDSAPSITPKITPISSNYAI